MTVQQYLSRYKYQVQFKKIPGHEEQSRFCIIYLSRIPRQLYFRTFTRGGFPGDEDKFHRGQLLLWIKILPWKENFLDLKTKQRSSYTRKGVLHKGNEIYSCARSIQVSTAAVLCSFYGLNRALEERTREGLRRAVMNTDELSKDLTQI